MRRIDAYRAPAPPPPGSDPPRQFLYKSRDTEPHVTALRLVAQCCVLALIASFIASIIGLPGWPLASAFAVGWAIWRWRRMRDSAGAVLRVDCGELIVTSRAGNDVLFRSPLRALADVRLDTKQIQRLRRETTLGSFNVGTRIEQGTDVSRILLVGADGEVVPLSDVDVAHLDATEAFGKIRTFLRLHGWVPEDEREQA